MPDGPSIKGSVLAGKAEELMKYLASHPLDPEVLARRFPDGEVAFLSRPISAGGWYDFRIYQRLLEFLRDYPGEGDYTNRWIIEYNCTAPFPDATCWTTQGFCNRMADEHGSPDLGYWKRLRPDMVQLKMHYAV